MNFVTEFSLPSQAAETSILGQ